MRVVLDTNVLLSGFTSMGVCGSVVSACLGSPEHTAFLSEHILREFRRHVVHRFGATEEEADVMEALMRRESQWVQPVPVPEDACRDPDDLPVLGTLAAAQADCLITGDADLLSLGEYAGRPILSPREAYERLV